MPTNGNYTQADLVEIDPSLGWPGGWGTARFKRSHDVMVALAAKQGYTLKGNEFYRNMAKQVFYRNLYLSGQGNPAAIPGTSKHGTGEAGDYNYPMTSWTTAMQNWYRANEAAQGMSSSQGVADGEPWHKVNVGEPSASIAGGGATPITPEEEEDVPTLTVIYCDVPQDGYPIDPNQSEKYPDGASTAVIHPFKGWIQTSWSFAPRAGLEAQTAIAGALKFKVVEVHLNHTGWNMAKTLYKL